MRRTLLALALSACLSFPIAAQHRSWSPANKALGVVATGLMFADWLQTIDIARRGGTNPDGSARGFQEMNPFLGSDPSVGRVNTLVPIGMVILLGTAHLIPDRKARSYFLVGFDTLELLNVIRNKRRGLRFNFHF